MPLKAYKLYSNFEGWAQAHKHSSYSVESALNDALDGEPKNPIEGLKSYICSLRELHSEIKGEISEARDWIRYFKSRKR